MTGTHNSWHRSPHSAEDQRSNTDLFLLIDDGIDDDRVFSIGVANDAGADGDGTAADAAARGRDRRPKLRTIRVQQLEGPDDLPVLVGTDINTSAAWSAPLDQLLSVTDLGTYFDVLRDRRDGVGRGWVDDEGSLF